MSARTRYVDLYIPVGPGAGSANPVRAMALGIGVAVGFALLVMVLVSIAFPGTDYPAEPVSVSTVPTTTQAVVVCAPFCPAPVGGQR